MSVKRCGVGCDVVFWMTLEVCLACCVLLLWLVWLDGCLAAPRGTRTRPFCCRWLAFRDSPGRKCFLTTLWFVCACVCVCVCGECECEAVLGWESCGGVLDDLGGVFGVLCFCVCGWFGWMVGWPLRPLTWHTPLLLSMAGFRWIFSA